MKKSGEEDEIQKEERAWVLTMWALRRAGKDATEARKILPRTDAPDAVRVQAVHTLGGHGNSGDRAILVATLAAPDATLRSAAACALAARKEDPTSIKGVLVDPVMLATIASAGDLPDEALATSQGRKIYLSRALREGDADGLLDLAREGEGQDRLDAIAALGRLASEEATEILQELAFDKDGTKEDIRKAAYRSLRRAQRISEKKEASS